MSFLGAICAHFLTTSAPRLGDQDRCRSILRDFTSDRRRSRHVEPAWESLASERVELCHRVSPTVGEPQGTYDLPRCQGSLLYRSIGYRQGGSVGTSLAKRERQILRCARYGAVAQTIRKKDICQQRISQFCCNLARLSRSRRERRGSSLRTHLTKRVRCRSRPRPSSGRRRSLPLPRVVISL
jgi:hypothetical protein